MEKETIAGVILIFTGVSMSMMRVAQLLGYLIVMIGFFLLIEGYSKRERKKSKNYEEEILKEYQEKYREEL